MARTNRRIPEVRVVSGTGTESAKAVVASALEARRDGARDAVAFVFGMWPVFAICGLMLLLAWSFAMFQSP